MRQGQATNTSQVVHADRGTATTIVDWLLESGHLEQDCGMLFIGPEAERQCGRRNFLELLSVFTASPELTVLHGRQEIGTMDPLALTRKADGPRVLALAGRSWRVTHIDWKRRRCFIEPSDTRVTTAWSSGGSSRKVRSG